MVRANGNSASELKRGILCQQLVDHKVFRKKGSKSPCRVEDSAFRLTSISGRFPKLGVLLRYLFGGPHNKNFGVYIGVPLI